jgi:hypothetical protein
METDGPLDAGPALDEVARARATLADRMTAPWWYYPVLGVLVAQHAFVQGFDNRNWTLPSFLLLIVGSAVLVMTWRRLSGLTVTTPTGPRSRILLVMQVLVAAVCIGVADVADDQRIAAAAAVIVVVATVVLGRRYDEALGQDLRDGGGRLAS